MCSAAELGIPDNPADCRQRRSSHDSFEVQAHESRLLFPRIVEDTPSDAPYGVPATSGYVVTFSLTVVGCPNLRVP